MRTIVDIPKEQLKALSKVCERRDISRAEAVRQALRSYIEQTRDADPNEVFGLWKDRHVDGLKYEDSIRGEWT